MIKTHSPNIAFNKLYINLVSGQLTPPVTFGHPQYLVHVREMADGIIDKFKEYPNIKEIRTAFFDHNSKKTLFCFLLNELKYVNVNFIKFKRYIQLSRAFLQS